MEVLSFVGQVYEESVEDGGRYMSLRIGDNALYFRLCSYDQDFLHKKFRELNLKEGDELEIIVKRREK